MNQIRAFSKDDLAFVQERDFLYSMELQYHEGYDMANSWTVLNDEGKIIGVGSLVFHSTWYDKRPNVMHRLVMDYCYDEAAPMVRESIAEGAKACFERITQSRAEGSSCISIWLEADEIDEMQIFLRQGFSQLYSLPVLKYDLGQEIKHYSMPQGITIQKLELSKSSIESYLEATALANEGCPDEKEELLFRKNDQSFAIYVAKDGEKIVSGVTLWDMADGRSATENIFTIPEYRHQNLAREVVSAGLSALKERGQKIATLSMDGDNKGAMKLYQSIGYELMYHTFEVRYTH